MKKQRTTGITLLSLFLGWISLTGFGNAYFMLKQSPFDPSIINFAPITYGILTLSASLGLWKMKKWGFIAYILWVASMIIFSFIFQLTLAGILWWKFAIFLIILVAIFGSIARYIYRTLQIAL